MMLMSTALTCQDPFVPTPDDLILFPKLGARVPTFNFDNFDTYHAITTMIVYFDFERHGTTQWYHAHNVS